MEKLKSKKNLIIIALVVVVILGLGGTFAFFTFFKPVEAFVLTMNGVPMQVKFNEGTNVVDNPYAYPISDSFAKENLSKLGYVDFTVSGGTPNQEYLYYELYLTEENGNKLDPNYIKVYLTDETDKQVVEPSIYNSLQKSTSENTNGKILHSETLTGIFEKKYRLYVWIDSTYSQNTEHQTFAFKVNLYAYNTEKNNLIDTLKAKAYKNNSELIAIDVTDKSNIKKCENVEECAEKTIEYRFSGPIANNYIRLKDDKEKKEDWRIIGIFKDELGQEYLRVVRDSVLPDSYLPTTYTKNNINIDGSTKNVLYTIKSSESSYAYWNKNDSGTELNRWEESGLQYFLNTEQDDNSVRGYLSYLSNDVKSLLLQEKMYLGTIHMNDNPKATPKESYFQERDVENCKDGKGLEENTSHTVVEQSSGCQVWKGNAATWTGAVSLMYPSDYGLSSIEENWTIPLYNDTIYSNDNGFEDENIKTSTWMYNTMKDSKTMSSWLLNPSSNEPAEYASYWMDFGDVHGHYPAHREDHGVRPVLNLKSDTLISDGDGTLENPYEI